jgi:hypothetical protein
MIMQRSYLEHGLLSQSPQRGIVSVNGRRTAGHLAQLDIVFLVVTIHIENFTKGKKIKKSMRE